MCPFVFVIVLCLTFVSSLYVYVVVSSACVCGWLLRVGVWCLSFGVCCLLLVVCCLCVAWRCVVWNL